MFNIKLQFVDFIKRQAVRKFLQRFKFGNFPAGYVMIKSAVPELRGILNGNIRPRAAALSDNLPHRLHAPENAPASPGDSRAVPVNVQAVTFIRRIVIANKNSGPSVIR